MRCYIEMHSPPAIMAEHDEHIENAKCGSRDGEKINTGYTVGMVLALRVAGEAPDSPVPIGAVT